MSRLTRRSFSEGGPHTSASSALNLSYGSPRARNLRTAAGHCGFVRRAADAEEAHQIQGQARFLADQPNERRCEGAASQQVRFVSRKHDARRLQLRTSGSSWTGVSNLGRDEEEPIISAPVMRHGCVGRGSRTHPLRLSAISRNPIPRWLQYGRRTRMLCRDSRLLGSASATARSETAKPCGRVISNSCALFWGKEI